MPNSKKGIASIAFVIELIVLVVGAFLYLVIRRNSNCLTIYNLIYLPPGDSISQKRVEGEASCPKAVSFVGKGSLWELEEKDAHEGPRRYQLNTDTMKFEQGDDRKYTFVNYLCLKFQTVNELFYRRFSLSCSIAYPTTNPTFWMALDSELLIDR